MDIKTLYEVGEMAKDLYYQDYKPDDAFFDLPHFKSLAVSIYSKMIDDDFQEQKQRNKVTDGFSHVEISPGWLIMEEIEAKKIGDEYMLKPKHPLFTFKFDSMGNGAQYIRTIKGDCKTFVKTSLRDVWKFEHMPRPSVALWYVKRTTEIILPNGHCNPGKVELWYVPALSAKDDNCVFPETYVIPVITTVLQVMFGAKHEMVVDKTNNSNPNTAPGTEIAP